jgi:hypothetical protein
LAPSEEHATSVTALIRLERSSHVTPASEEVKTDPLFESIVAAATRRVPSAEEATATQSRLLSRGVQFVPESWDV